MHDEPHWHDMFKHATKQSLFECLNFKLAFFSRINVSVHVTNAEWKATFFLSVTISVTVRCADCKRINWRKMKRERNCICNRLGRGTEWGEWVSIPFGISRFNRIRVKNVWRVIFMLLHLIPSSMQPIQNVSLYEWRE